MTDPVWISEELVLAIHRRQLAEHGGLDGVREPATLASALAKPHHLLAYGEDVDLPALAAAYAFGIARNHPFLDGNKRTAYVVCRTFLRLNGSDMTAPADERYQLFLRLAEGTLPQEDLAAWLRSHAPGSA